jgi:hypothetical protein
VDGVDDVPVTGAVGRVDRRVVGEVSPDRVEQGRPPDRRGRVRPRRRVRVDGLDVPQEGVPVVVVAAEPAPVEKQGDERHPRDRQEGPGVRLGGLVAGPLGHALADGLGVARDRLADEQRVEHVEPATLRVGRRRGRSGARGFADLLAHTLARADGAISGRAAQSARLSRCV